MEAKDHFCQNRVTFCDRNDTAPETLPENLAKRIESETNTFLHCLVWRNPRKMARFCLEKFCVGAISLLGSFSWLHRLRSSKQAKNLFVRNVKLYSADDTLLEKSIGNRANATVVGFHICPICLAQARLLRRAALLPLLKYCPTHHVAFHTHCTCGCPLILFSRRKQPFRCFTCGLDWAQLPHLRPSPDEVRLECDLWTLYEFFLVEGTDELKASALSLVRQYLKTHQPLALKLVSGRTLSLTSNLDQLSLGYVIDLLVSIGIAPKDIMRNTHSQI